MTITSVRFRRLITMVGVVAALLLGYGSIRAAATWTAASAPLTVPPVSVESIQDRLGAERIRSGDMQARLDALAARSIDLTTALEAAQLRIAADTDNATALAKELKTAKLKLARLEASIAKAKLAARHRQVVVTKTVIVKTTTAPSHHGDDGDDEGGGDD
jgi:hypothetical protein